ncbi:hypothetical protein ANN_18924 [Periplaneta americana]|uniref:Uncharacterized protein n=1 Tax=Periplaneta americana TaxID=6978 RepID=A0ABQ8SQU4_PERAM|nr:hypothetical protein ANN_18924 [Periplaneta americana]
MAGLCEGGNEPSGSLKAISVYKNQLDCDGDYHHLCKLMEPVRHRWSISDVIVEIRNTVMTSDCSASLRSRVGRPPNLEPVVAGDSAMGSSLGLKVARWIGVLGQR